MLRSVARGTLEAVAAGTGISAVGRIFYRRRVAILAYHNVIPETEAGRGDESLHIPLPTFLRQVERLARTYDFTDLDTAVSGPPGKRPRAVVTFDDAYRGAVTVALPELARRGIPSVMFVAPGLLGERSTWWDELGQAGKLDDTTRSTALVEHRGLAPAVRRWAFPDGQAPALSDLYGISTVEELREHASGPAQIASHTWGHEFLPALPADDLERTLRTSLDWVRRFEGSFSDGWLALPYGAGSPDLVATALQLGYRGVLRINGGLWDPANERSFLPRINVPAGLSVRGLELRTSGLLNR